MSLDWLVRRIVEGETKFSKIGELSSETVSKGDVKARDLQHLFLAMTKEASTKTAPKPGLMDKWMVHRHDE